MHGSKSQIYRNSSGRLDPERCLSSPRQSPIHKTLLPGEARCNPKPYPTESAGKHLVWHGTTDVPRHSPPVCRECCGVRPIRGSGQSGCRRFPRPKLGRRPRRPSRAESWLQYLCHGAAIGGKERRSPQPVPFHASCFPCRSNLPKSKRSCFTSRRTRHCRHRHSGNCRWICWKDRRRRNIRLRQCPPEIRSAARASACGNVLQVPLP